MNSYLHIDHVSMTFKTDAGPLNVLQGVDIKVQQGEFISLIGHSGCGKSTVLNIVAGLLTATEGGVVLECQEVNEPGPDRAVVFQNHSLLPWLSAYDNVRLAVDQVFKRTKSKAERDEWTRHNLELVNMSHALDRKPDEISGGMKQRVGIARALAMEPKVLLMDEPFGALDSLTRTHMQDSLMAIQTRLNNTVMMITHDVDEAVLLSDRIVMMSNGPSATIGEILDVNLERPRDRLALAEDPAFNHYRAEVVKFLHERHQSEGGSRTETDQTDDTRTTTHLAPAAASHSNVIPIDKARTQTSSGSRLEKARLSLGFVPLTDCAPLVIAAEKGFFENHGLQVELSRESSWANIRDKVSTGMLDGAQMLAAMPLATAFDTQHTQPMVTSLSLDLNGNAITLSRELYGRMIATGFDDIDSATGAARALKAVIDQDRDAGRPVLSFAVVFPQSSHNYLLRYWMADAGIDPDRDVRLIVVPPPQVGHYLRVGLIAGCCVGEPWNTLAVSDGLGRIVATSYDIWNNHPEKVFAVTRFWAECNPNTHHAVLKSLLEACAWLEVPDNRSETCEILSQGRYVNVPVEVLETSMSGQLRTSSVGETRAAPDHNVFHRYAANMPWRSHALWYYSQMLRWGEIDSAENIDSVARSVYRPEAYRAAARALHLPYPVDDNKAEGQHELPWMLPTDDDAVPMGPDRFMDGRIFQPDAIEDYVSGFAISRWPKADVSASDSERADGSDKAAPGKADWSVDNTVPSKTVGLS
ncbi:MAG: ABC transporter substrate-binding protein [Granulosicoccus sp.]|nr:ABC transporter substrate-binding protein [Granulosicoccus sp.]